MHKSLKIRTQNLPSTEDILESLHRQGFKIGTHNQSGRHRFVIKSGIGLVRLKGRLSLARRPYGFEINAEGKVGLTVGGVLVCILLGFTVVALLMVALVYLVESSALETRLSNSLSDLKDEYTD